MNILSIGGSDPSSGAGVQGDLRTIFELGGYGFTIITAITGQNTVSFRDIQAVSPRLILAQIDSVLSDFKIDSIIISMVYNKEVIRAIHSRLKKIKIPIIVDPVITSTTGGRLLRENALAEYRKRIIPLATIITPNVKEAEIISGKKISDENDLEDVARIIKSYGTENIIITGIEKQKEISDYIMIKNEKYLMSHKRLPIVNHGSGCTFSAALAVSVGKGKSIKESIKFARRIALKSIKNSKHIGKGINITDLRSEDQIIPELSKGINEFAKMKNASHLIPECQTNFTFSKENPKRLSDIAGVLGRIVKTGKTVTVAGEMQYGGSRHVASALLEINKHFPEIRSAINIRFDLEILKRLQRDGLSIAKYNRGLEPKSIKNIENSSITWGVNQAIGKKTIPPDIIYHKGDHGKEPMILVFGNNPNDVLKKIKKIHLKNIET